MFVKINGIGGEMLYVNRNQVISITSYDNAEAEKQADGRIDAANQSDTFKQLPQAQQDSWMAAQREEANKYKEAKALVYTSENTYAVSDTVEELLERFTAV